MVAVTDTSAVASRPTGSVVLSSGAGSIGSGCGMLVAAGASTANCTVAFTPAVAGLGSVSGTYGGHPAHGASDGTAPVTAQAPAGASRAAVALKKCKKRKRRNATSAKKRCKKKQKSAWIDPARSADMKAMTPPCPIPVHRPAGLDA